MSCIRRPGWSGRSSNGATRRWCCATTAGGITASATRRAVSSWADGRSRWSGRRRSPAGSHRSRRRARSPPPRRRRGSPARAASSSRAFTMPSSSRRCGATTCVRRASSSNRWTAPTTWPRSSGPSARARDGGSASCSTIWSRAPRSRGWPPRSITRKCSYAGTDSSTCGPRPDIPRETSWKDGICLAVTGSAATEPRAFWRRLLGKVDSYRDLDTSLIGAVEELIDFVTAG